MRFRSLACALVLALLPACSSGRDGYVFISEDGEASPVITEVIDIGGALVSPPGESVALNVDVSEGGVWRVATTCDTKLKGYICAWDLVVSVDREAGPLEVLANDTLEDPDEVIPVDESALRIYMENGEDEDFVDLSAPQGATLTLDLILDGFHSDPAIRGVIGFVSMGAIRAGARSNPVAFEPTAP